MRRAGDSQVVIVAVIKESRPPSTCGVRLGLNVAVNGFNTFDIEHVLRVELVTGLAFKLALTSAMPPFAFGALSNKTSSTS